MKDTLIKLKNSADRFNSSLIKKKKISMNSKTGQRNSPRETNIFKK